jgi:chaperone protein EcpD
MKRALYSLLVLVAATVGLVTGTNVQASVVINGTRVIFPAQEREVTIKLTNNGKAPALVKAWLDDGNLQEAPEKIAVPFLLTPALFRLDPTKGQTLRLIYTNEPLAQDKETLFWLNVLEIPPKAQDIGDANRLQLAIRSRIKVIFRPKGLAGQPDDAPGQTTWQLVRAADGKGYALKGANPTPYFVNLGSVSLNAGGKQFEAGNGYIGPRDSALFPVKGLDAAPGGATEVEFQSLNDWGGGVPGKKPVAAPAAR